MTPIKTGKRYFAPDGVVLHPDGLLNIPYGWSWDGASGPALDTKNIMVPSAAHDALYELIRDGGLPIEHRQAIDEFFYELGRRRGMSWLRSQWIKLGVRLGGNHSARVSSKTYEAP